MKKCSLLLITLALASGLAWPLQVVGREGRDDRKGRSEARGGGQERSHGANPSQPRPQRQSVDRTPSMSRSRPEASRQPSRPASQARPAPQVTRPVPSQRPAQVTRPAPQVSRPVSRVDRPTSTVQQNQPQGRSQIPRRGSGSPSIAAPVFSRRFSPKNDRNPSGEEVKSYIQKSRDRKIDPHVLHQKQRDFQEHRVDRQHKFKREGDYARNRIYRDRPGHRRWFNDHFYRDRHFYPRYYSSSIDWWRPAPWIVLNSWVAWNEPSPVYYIEGSYPVYLASEYQQTTTPYVETVEGNWLPLGVFAIGKTAEEVAVSTMFLQLALGRNGEMAGTYYNATTDKTYEVEGTTDKITQQAAWNISDSPHSPIMSTGLYNLSQDETEITLSFPNGVTETWLMIRMTE